MNITSAVIAVYAPEVHIGLVALVELATLYKKDESCFEIVCDSRGYSEAVMSFYVSEHGGNAGESISRAEFEKNDR